tara:strand:+ start:925 stop:1344 length:420 start_codon:yes stop_codon:yes gene_type:complete
MQTSIKQIIENIKEVVQTNFTEINYVDFEKYSDKGLDKTGVRLVYSMADSMTFNLQVDTFALKFEMLDLINTVGNEDERRKEVISDCFGIASMFVDYLKRYGYYFPDSISVNTVHKRYKDGLGGVEFTINFDLQKTCLI